MSMDARPQYAEWAPPTPLRDYLACSWVSRGAAANGYDDDVLPDARRDIVWDGRELVLAGSDTGPRPVRTTVDVAASRAKQGAADVAA
jgi:hypothetical protein